MAKKKYRRWSVSYTSEALEFRTELSNLSKIDENYEKEEKSNDELNLSIKSTTSFNSWSVSPDRQMPLNDSSITTPKSSDEIYSRRNAYPNSDKQSYKGAIKIKGLKSKTNNDVIYQDKIIKSYQKIDWSTYGK